MSCCQAVEPRTVQWEVPAACDNRVKSLLIPPRFLICVLATSGATLLAARNRLTSFLAYVVPQFSDTRSCSLGLGPSGATPSGRRGHACSEAPGVP